MRVSICTTTARRGYTDIQARLFSAQQLQGCELEWVLVDFAYEDRAGTMKALTTELGLSFVHVPNVRDDQKFFRDITRNRNLALSRATGDVIIFVDDYAVVKSNFVAKHLEIISQGCLSAGNMFRLEKQIDDLPTLVATPFIDILEQYTPYIGMDHRAVRNNTVISRPYRAVGITYTGNLGFPRKISDCINGFDPRMESGLEDCDFGMRAHMAGFGCFFNPDAATINLATGHIPYTYSFDHVHDVEPFISNTQNKFWGNNKLPENEFLRIEFKEHYRIAHCKECGAHGMVDPSELMAHTQLTRQMRVPEGLPGGLDSLLKGAA